MLRKQSPNLRLLISFADTAQGHHGGIYQAAGWTYAGLTTTDKVFIIRGEPKHPKTIHSLGWKQNEAWLRQHVDPTARRETLPPKHRYLLPLNKEMTTRIAPLAQPYPKRAKVALGGPPSARGRCDSVPSAPIHEAAHAG